jgi:parallel beta-helix repeat protein
MQLGKGAMIKRTLLAISVVFGLVGLVPGTASALTCGITITHDTTLHHDLDCTGMSSGTAVTFGKAHLTLNLNGHKIIGPSGTDNLDGIYSSYKDSTITNGTITGFGEYMIYLYNNTGMVVSNVKFVDDPADPYPYGVYDEYGIANVFRGNTFVGIYDGLDLYGGAQNRVLHNKATNSGNTYLLYTEYEYGDVVRGNVGKGVEYGIYDDSSNRMNYVNNVMNGGSGYGFYLDCDSYGIDSVVGNVANGNTDDGFYIYDCYNSEDYQQVGGLVKGNTAKHNGGDGFYDYYSINTTWTENTAIDNDDYGFNLDYPTGDVITHNVANGNHSNTGMYLEDTESYYAPVDVSNNVANNNLSYGFYSDYGVPSSGNSAHGNSALNCYNVGCV